jgi:hypothetical protein
MTHNAEGHSGVARAIRALLGPQFRLQRAGNVYSKADSGTLSAFFMYLVYQAKPPEAKRSESFDTILIQF